MKEELQVHRYGGHKGSVALVIWKLNLAAIHEQGEWLHIHSQCILALREGRDLLVAEFSPCLGCHLGIEKGTHVEVNFEQYFDGILSCGCGYDEDISQTGVNYLPRSRKTRMALREIHLFFF